MDIIESGRVVAIEESGVWVETIRSSACGSCAARSGCGHRTLAGMLTGDKGLVRARNSDRLQAALCSINDRVEISIRGSTLTKSALTLYGGPLALGLAFAMSQADSSDLFVAGAFFVGLAVGFMSLRWIDSRGLLGNTEPVLERLVETAVQPVMVVDPTQ